MAELKPCPCCGAIPIIETKRTPQAGKGLYKNKASTIIYRVIDENVDCHFFPSTGWYYLKQEAIEDWNRRIETFHVADVVEVVRCKDCVWGRSWKNTFGIGSFRCDLFCTDISPEAFCSYGERRADNG